MDLIDVERAMLGGWAVRGAEAPEWPDPHPDMESPREEEYSRVTDWSKYRSVGLRVWSWVQALLELGVASTTSAPPGDDPRVPQTSFWLRPAAAGAAPVRIYLTQLEGVTDSGVTIGDERLPCCGCDECDRGSEELLDDIDQLFADVLAGKVAGDHRSWLASGESAADLPQ